MKSRFRSHRLGQKKTSFVLILFFFLLLGGTFGWIAYGDSIMLRMETNRIEEEKAELASVPVMAAPVREKVEEEDSAEDGDSEEIFDPKEAFLQSLVTDPTTEMRLDVPFVCQNPFQDEAGWEWHDESCEEAAAYQVVLYYTGEQVSAQEAHEDFLDMIAWQEERFGSHKDLYGEEMREFIRDYFEYKDSEVLYFEEVNKESIQQILASGHPIIIGIQGELLNNPFYPYPGYHMLTIVGYTDTRVITNDVGTKRGEGYPYDWDTLLDANAAVGGGMFVIVP